MTQSKSILKFHKTETNGQPSLVSV